MNNAIKSYFKELTSTYELLRLGVHRPALRIAPDQGFVKVPMLLSNQLACKYASTETPSRKKNPFSKSGGADAAAAAAPTAVATPGGAESGAESKPVVKEEPVSIEGTSKPSTPQAADAKAAPAANSAVDVDKWFDEIQQNPSTSLIGRNLKSFAQIFKLIALKISTGYSSTLASNIQKSFATNTDGQKVYLLSLVHQGKQMFLFCQSCSITIFESNRKYN